MKILRLETQGFGCLAGHVDFQPIGVNLWIAPNAWGKSTLAIAIREALYGPSRLDRRLVEHRELAALEPMEGEVFNVRLDIEVNERPLCIIRDFTTGEVKVLEGGFHGIDVTDEFRASRGKFEIGERLLRLSREDFIKSVFVGQGEVSQVREATALTGALQRIADAETGKGTVANAIEVLDEVVRRYPLRRSGEVMLTTEKKRLQNDFEKARQQIHQLEAKRHSIEDKAQELATLEDNLERKKTQRRQVVYLEKKAELKEIEQRLCTDETQRESVKKLEGEFEELSPYATFPVAQQQEFHRLLDDIEMTKKDIEQLNVEKSEQEEEFGRLESKLKEMDFVAEFTQQERDVLLSLVGRLKAAGKAEAEARSKVEEERQRLEIQDINPSRYEELLKKFESLTSEERQFLRNVSSKRQDRALRKSQEETRQSSASRSIREIEERRDKHRRAGKMLLLGGGGLLVIGLVVAFAAIVALGTGLAGLGLIFGLVGILLRRTAGSLRADELDAAKSEKQKAEETLKQIQQEVERETQRLAKLAEKIGLSDKDVLLSEFIEFEDLSQETERFRNLMHNYEQANGQINGLKDEARPLLKRADSPDWEINYSILKDLLEKVNCALTLKNKRDTAKSKVKEFAEKINKKEEHLKETSASVKKLLKDAGLNENLESEEAQKKFDEGVQKARRLHQLEGEILPKERERLLGEQEKTKLCRRAQELQQQIEQAEAGPGGDKLAVLMPEKERSDYQREREEVDEQITCKQSRVNALEREIGETLKEVRENLPWLLQKREELKRRLRRAEQFEAAVSIAKGTLERLASEVYEVWAEALNTFAADAFQAILPYYEDPRFDQNLHFTFVLPKRPGRIDLTVDPGSAPRLSGGELEQVHLIARFAISDYLSRGDVRPPIILDEPFPNSHDNPFLAGMQLLAKLSQQRQVIVLTCHEVRHRWLLEQAPELEKVVHEITFEGRCGPPLRQAIL